MQERTGTDTLLTARKDICMPLQSLCCVQLFVTLWTVAHQAPLSMRFLRQEYWSGLPFPPPGDLPKPGLEPTSPVTPILAGRLMWVFLFVCFLTTELPDKTQRRYRASQSVWRTYLGRWYRNSLSKDEIVQELILSMLLYLLSAIIKMYLVGY